MSADTGRKMSWGDLLSVGRPEIMALHKTWFAFFLTFFVWFNVPGLATTIMKVTGLTKPQMTLLAICNVALTVPGRVLVGIISDRIGPRKTFTIVMVLLSIPCFVFAFATSYSQMLVARLILSMVGTGFVVGIHMTSLWFTPRDMGFAQGVEAGLGNWGSSIAAAVLPFVALTIFGGYDDGWRYAIALSGAIMLVYGIYYWFAITDGPPGTVPPKSRKAPAIEVSSWLDLVNAIAWTIPVIGVVGVTVWRIHGMGFMSDSTRNIAYFVIVLVILYQIIQLLRVNLPILKKGVPEDDRYRFTNVGALCLCYVATFGAELGVISMLPMFFQKTFNLSPQMAGLIGSLFAFLNFFSRALGGWISDRMSSRRNSMLLYLVGVTITFVLMGLINSSWPLIVAILVTLACAMFVTGGCGTTFALVPLIKRRVTGQISGYVGAYGNVGAVMYLTVATFQGVTDSYFFLFIGATALATLVFCFLFLREPKDAFATDHKLSSVDRELMGGH